MKRKPMKTKFPGVLAYAWLSDLGLCRWAEPDKQRLLQGERPTPKAKPILVRIVPETELRRLLAAKVMEEKS